jgi:glycosyltransferase involved in cell wall biosynthesis
MISVLLPVYNGGFYLKESVESVLTQKNAVFELLILDDCSTDNSYSYLSSLNDSRIILYKNDINQGLFYNLNYLIRNAKGTLLKLWAQDDIMLPGCLEAFLQFHSKNSNIGFSYCQPEMINELGAKKIFSREDNTPEILNKQLHGLIAMYTGSIAGNISNTCLSIKAIEKVGLFNEEMKISADFDMWVRIAEFFPVGHLNQKLIQLRDHDGQLSRNSKYIINHIVEDMVVYQRLLNYLDEQKTPVLRYYFRNYKLVFYYTLMVKYLLKFELINAWKVIRLLNRIDSFIAVSLIFAKVKIFRIKPNVFNVEKYTKQYR